ncbi:MAG TPA: BREX-6 system adenine-specific DNA-methyltransferase PglX, partial [Nannocystaceae bacterium]|nr:BREX-6 system adenine-specific DNA-methyltransferase PglX [Nannocystaceae bacterium]
VRELKLLDPAAGSGHFLVVAFDLLFALYQEEASHRGEADQPQWSDRAIVERILEKNLHGLDLDPRAIQIAAAALWLKARQTCRDARPRRLNLVASNLRLAGLPKDDPALVDLRRAIERETGIPADVTDTLVDALRGADHLGSLLRIDRAVEDAIDACEHELSRPKGGIDGSQGDLLAGTFPKEQRVLIGREEAKTTILDRLEEFLKRHTSGEDLGLRLRGEQLATGVRFVRMLREGTYHLVVGNPPYQGTTKMADAVYVHNNYQEGKADLYAAFLLRGLHLTRQGGHLALMTMRNWMFIKQFAHLRSHLLAMRDLRALANLGTGAFGSRSMDDVISSAAIIVRNGAPGPARSVAVQAAPLVDMARDASKPVRRNAELLAQGEVYSFLPSHFRCIPEWPLVYWWPASLLSSFVSLSKIGDVSPAKFGLTTGNNVRFAKFAWEVGRSTPAWAPFIFGAEGQRWLDQLSQLLRWQHNGLEVKLKAEYQYGSYSKQIRNEDTYFRKGVAFSAIGQDFCARAHRCPGIISNVASSVFAEDIAAVTCLMNTSTARSILSSLNPGVHFEVGDVNRLPLFPIANADDIFATVERAFGEHESHREPSVEFRRPGPSPWRHAQDWAQRAVDRPEGAPLPEYVPEYVPETATDLLSYALGVALGRFGAGGEGILDPAKDDLGHALPAGILFLDATLTPRDLGDGLGHPAAAPLHAVWEQHGPTIAPDDDLRGWLVGSFFDLHRKMYDNRPIHWPLSSEKRTFVAWVTIHRWTGNTLRILLAEHLVPRLTRLEGELADLRAAREGGDKKAARAAEKRFAQVQKWRDELAKFIADVEQCAEKGPPPEGPKCPPRQVDARYVPDLDDGVMINSAALWPLLTPQWKDPRKWWRELASAEDKKDYDWSHLAMRYWPDRVDAKCQQDPSLAVAHGCFWKYHPARAWAWELRLQDEIAPDFRITEAPYRGDGGDATHRAAFLATRGAEAVALLQAELLRRLRKRKQPLADYFLRHAGLWTNHPEACWQLEHAVIHKQKAPFRLLADDEPEARATYCAEHPRVVGERDKLLESFAQADMFSGTADLGQGEPDDDAGADDEPSDDE